MATYFKIDPFYPRQMELVASSKVSNSRYFEPFSRFIDDVWSDQEFVLETAPFVLLGDRKKFGESSTFSLNKWKEKLGIVRMTK
jgi:hypothetical protein